MEKITKDLNKKFNNKYHYLKLLNVTLDYSLHECYIYFLYPYTIKDIKEEERREIEEFLKSLLSLNSKLIIKYKKSFLDEELVVKEVLNYIKDSHKSIASNIKIEHISSSFNDLEVDLKIRLNPEMYNYFLDNNLQEEMNKFLEKHFCATFKLRLIKDESIEIKDERKEVIIIPKAKTERYQVFIIKNLVGNDIPDKPEFIKNIKTPKESVILAGEISNLKKGEFKPRKAKTEDEVKHFYSFMLNDGTKMPVTYFSSKTAEKNMDKLVDGQNVLILGNVRVGYNDKLCLYVKKIALCEIVKKENEDNKNKELLAKLPDDYLVVKPEKLTVLEQDNLFVKINYNDNINGKCYVVFDVETTGLDDEACEIIELAAAKVIDGKICEKFQTLVKPKKEIPQLITNLTSISNEMVESSPSIDQVIIDFYRFSKDCILSGYNVGFDMKFILHAADNIGLKFENQVVDVMAMVRTSPLRVGNFKLGTVVKALNLELKDAHRAYNDAYATALVLLKLNEIK